MTSNKQTSKSAASTMKMSLIEGQVSSGSFNDAFRKYYDTIRYDTQWIGLLSKKTSNFIDNR